VIGFKQRPEINGRDVAIAHRELHSVVLGVDPDVDNTDAGRARIAFGPSLAARTPNGWSMKAPRRALLIRAGRLSRVSHDQDPHRTSALREGTKHSGLPQGLAVRGRAAHCAASNPWV
jgi:hypothetical protein